MRSTLSEAIIKTVCYSEVFSYPLTFSELHKYLIYHKKVSKQELLFELKCIKNTLVQEGEYITFTNTSNLVKVRKERHKESKRKYAKALLVAQLLSYIPTIKMIGISGSLSMFNSKKEDDIDLFFITSRHSLWITRLLVTFLLMFSGQKRERVGSFAKDKICPNMYLSEENLSLPPTLRSLYTAHEVAQLKIIHSKDYMEQKFLSENKWALKYMPHSFTFTEKKYAGRRYLSAILFPLNSLLYVLQYFYMRKRITHEKIGLSHAMFHPRKSNEIIQTIYKLKVSFRLSAYKFHKVAVSQHNKVFVN